MSSYNTAEPYHCKHCNADFPRHNTKPEAYVAHLKACGADRKTLPATPAPEPVKIVSKPKKKHIAKHGTSGRYNVGCRCEPCCAAKTRSTEVFRQEAIARGEKPSEITVDAPSMPIKRRSVEVKKRVSEESIKVTEELPSEQERLREWRLEVLERVRNLKMHPGLSTEDIAAIAINAVESAAKAKITMTPETLTKIIERVSLMTMEAMMADMVIRREVGVTWKDGQMMLMGLEQK